MQVVRYGHWGPALVYVPSSAGDHRELAAYGFDAVCAPWIEAGRVQVFAIEGYGPQGLFSDVLPPVERIRRYARFERYAATELLPWVRATAANHVGVIGASYGGFVAANLLFKHPRALRVAGGLGGVYGLWHRLNGHHDDDVYFHTPLEYLPRLQDPAILEAIRATRGIDLYGAADDPWLWATRDLARALAERGLPHHVEIWPSPADHHERCWARQLARFLERHY